MYFFYPSPQEANYFVNIDEVAELKFDAAAKQVSQFEPAVSKYRPDWEPADLAKAKEEMRHEHRGRMGITWRRSAMPPDLFSIDVEQLISGWSPETKHKFEALDYAMWGSDVPTERNPMELVSIKGVTNRVRKPRSLTVHEFKLLLGQFEHDLRFRAFVLIAVSFGLRISEALGLKWQDVDWLSNIRIQRGVVKQIIDDVKSAHSARTMVCADELRDVLQLWRQSTEFSAEADWVFASPSKLGRQPICYTFVWEMLRDAGRQSWHRSSKLPHVSPYLPNVVGFAWNSNWSATKVDAAFRHPHHNEHLW